MANEAHDILLDARQVVFNELRDLFFETGTEIEFLKINGTTGEFETVDIKDGEWLLRFDSFRKQMMVEVAEGPDWMQTTMETATHLRLGDDIYVITAGDITEPKGFDVTWKIYCEKFVARSQYRPLY